MTSSPSNKIKYLTNKDLLEEIHRSKKTYCEFLSEEYGDYDLIVTDLATVTVERLEQAREKKYNDSVTKLRKEAQAQGIKNPKIQLDINTITLDSIVIRLMTFDHIPINHEKLHKAKSESDRHIKCNFPPFQHFIYRDNNFICVGKSHWIGGLENGYFSNSHGTITNRLALMFMKLVERYSHRGNWRGYCVDEKTEALTQRGWLGINDITENDIILSYDQGYLKWSKIKSIYRGEYNGLMHKITTKTGVDMLITPEHKLVTPNGLVPVELLKESDKVILLGEAVQDDQPVYSDALVELAGWIMTEGGYSFSKYTGKIGSISLWQNEGPYADRIRNCLKQLGYKFSERSNLQYTNKYNVCFRISSEHSREFAKVLPTKNLTMDFILSLTTKQRELLLETMIDGDGWRVGKQKRYVQKSKEHIDLFQALCTLVGHRSNTHHVQDRVSFGKITNYYNVNVFSKRKNQTNVSCLDFNGGKRNGRNHPGQGKINHPNEPTTPYNDWVWCPETEYGCFVARRNGTVYLTSNTYNDEMRSQALLQLSQMGLQFDESKSDTPNPFAYFTAAVNNSFTRILNLEKRSQNIRDDLLIMHGAMPSYTRQTEHDLQKLNGTTAIPNKSKRGFGARAKAKKT